MAKLNNKFSDKMLALGHCDEHRACFIATAASLPNGDYGMVAVSLKGSELLIFDVKGFSNVEPTRLVNRMPVNEITGFEMSSNLFAELFKGFSFRFKYNGFQWRFKNCAQMKEQLAAIKQAVESAGHDQR